jgi:hypothetical protein
MPPSLLLVSSLHLPILTIKPEDLHSPFLTINRMLMASPPTLHPTQIHFGSWMFLEPFSIKGTSLQQSWLLQLLSSIITWLFRMLGYQSGWFFPHAHSIYVLRLLRAFLTCMLLSLCFSMWRQLRTPFSCLTCVSEDL